MKNANDGIHEILKDAVWEYEGSLPSWTSRHGIITGDSFEYGNKHLFTGYARVLNREYDKRIKTL